MDTYARLVQHTILVNKNANFVDFDLNEETHTLGRGKKGEKKSNYLKIPLPYISSVHATFIKVEDIDSGEIKVEIKDESSNGTFLNGTKIGKNNVEELKDGDVLTFYMGKKVMDEEDPEGKVEEVSFMFQYVKMEENDILNESNSSSHQVDILTAQLDGVRKEREEGESMRDQLQSEIQKLTQQVQDLSNTSIQYQKTIDTLTSSLKASEQAMEAKEQDMKVVCEREGELKEEVEKLRESVSERDGSIQQTREEIESLKQSHSSTLSTLASKREEMESQLQDQISAAREDVRERERECVRVKGVCEEKTHTITSLTTTNHTLQSQLEDLTNSHNNQMGVIQDQISHLTSHLIPQWVGQISPSLTPIQLAYGGGMDGGMDEDGMDDNGMDGDGSTHGSDDEEESSLDLTQICPSSPYSSTSSSIKKSPLKRKRDDRLGRDMDDRDGDQDDRLDKLDRIDEEEEEEGEGMDGSLIISPINTNNNTMKRLNESFESEDGQMEGGEGEQMDNDDDNDDNDVTIIHNEDEDDINEDEDDINGKDEKENTPTNTNTSNTNTNNSSSN